MSRLIELQTFSDAVGISAWNKFRATFPELKTNVPRITISKRMKTTAGNCKILERHITLCYDLLDLYPDHFKHDTIPHELGHQVAYDLFNIGGDNKRNNWHGKEWNMIMIKAGFETSTYHNLVNNRYKK